MEVCPSCPKCLLLPVFFLPRMSVSQFVLNWIVKKRSWQATHRLALLWWWMGKGVRKSRQRWTCTWDWDLWFHFSCSPSIHQPSPGLPPHPRAWLQWCGYTASPRGTQDWELGRELANFRWIQLGGVFSLEKPKVSDGTMNQGRQGGHRCAHT